MPCATRWSVTTPRAWRGSTTGPSPAGPSGLAEAEPAALAARVFAGMRARGVLIKNVSTMHALLANCVRLTVGTADENAQMLAALQASL